MAGGELTTDEQVVLGHYRRLKKTHKAWTLTARGQWRSGRQQIRISPSYEVVVETGILEAVFDAIE